jgi:NADH:ubiquinone oxidoreductase subunit 6 (subunit J)
MRLFWAAYSDASPPALDPEKFSLRAVATDLFTIYLLPFEVIGLLLLVAVVAASWVAKRPAHGEPGEAPDEARAMDVIPTEVGK